MERIDSHPFKYPIVANDLTSEHPRLRGLNGTDYLVRNYGFGFGEDTRTIQLQEYKSAMERWKRLGNYGGLMLPKFEPIIAADHNGFPAFLLLTERIPGENLEDFEALTDCRSMYKDVFEVFMVGLVEYSKDVMLGRGEYLYDQNLSQYVMSRNGHGHDQIYFVDLGMEYQKLPQTTGDHYSNSFFFARYLPCLIEMIEGLESKIGEPLYDSRSAMERLLKSVSSGYGGISYARALIPLALQSRFFKAL